MPNFSDNFLTYDKNFTIIDDFDYAVDADVQAVYAEGGDGGNPTVRTYSQTPDQKIGNTSVRFPITDSTHSSTWTATISAVDLSEMFGVETGTPLKGYLALSSVTRSSNTAITAASIRIGSSSSDYITLPLSFNGTAGNPNQMLTLASSLTVTGTPNWTNVTYVQVRATSASGTPTLDLSGLRVSASDLSGTNLRTSGIWVDAGFDISKRQNKATLMVSQTTATGTGVTYISGLQFTNFTLYGKLRFHVSSSGYEAGFAFCSDGGGTSTGLYSVVIDCANSEIQLDKWVSGVRTTLQAVAFTSAVDTDYVIKIVSTGTRKRVYLSSDDGNTFTKYLDVTDSTFTSGYVGTFTRGLVVAEYYYIQVFDQPYVRFNDWSFANRGQVNLIEVQEDSAPSIEMNYASLVSVNRDTFLQKNWRSKYINVRGDLKTATDGDMTDMIDDFKRNLAAEEGSLIVGKATGTAGEFSERKYTASAIDLDNAFKRNHWNLTYLPFSMTFRAADGYAKALSPVTMPTYNWTSSTFNQSLVFKGSGNPLPTLTFTLTDATPSSGTINTITLLNLANGKSIIVQNSTTFANNDVLSLNFENKIVTVNGVRIDYTGIMADDFFNPGLNNIRISILGSALLNQSNLWPGGGTTYGPIAGTTFHAQSFQVSATTTYRQFDLNIYKGGNAGDVTLRIETNSGSAPSGTLVDATNGTVTKAASTITGVLGDYQSFILPGDLTLNSATTYWMVIKSPATVPGFGSYFSNTTTSPSYASGNFAISVNSGSSYVADSTHDLAFRIYQSGPAGISGTLVTTYTPRYV